jgi:AcrR family transcriptional regulator
LSFLPLEGAGMKKELKRQKILGAASECFARFGYDKTTLEDIGKAVGLNKASLYYYYRNKESLFCDVIVQEAETYMQDLQKKVRGSRSSESRIVSYFNERLNYYKNVVNLHNLSLDTIRKVDPIFQEVYKVILLKEAEFLAGIIKEGQESGEFIKSESQKVAELLLEVASAIRYKEVHIAALRSSEEPDYSRIQDTIRNSTRLILKGLKVN